MSQIVPNSSLLDSAVGFWVQNIYVWFPWHMAQEGRVTWMGVLTFLPGYPLLCCLWGCQHTHTPSLFRGPVGFGMRPLGGPPQRPGQDMRDFRDVSGGTKLRRG